MAPLPSFCEPILAPERIAHYPKCGLGFAEREVTVDVDLVEVQGGV